jgi:heparinase II/III-like protein
MSGDIHGQETSRPQDKGGLDLQPRAPTSRPSTRLHKPRFAFLQVGFRSVLRGQISAGVAVLEYFRRCRVAVTQRRERRMVEELGKQPARLRPEFAKLTAADLLRHFRERTAPAFLPGFEDAPPTIAALQRKLFPTETQRLIESARLITNAHRWSLLGFGEMDFGKQIDWNRDPLSSRVWPLDFHADLVLWHNDGSDIRVLWELNRLGHFLTLGRAYALTQDELFVEEFLEQLADWHHQNPVGRGANWSCAMEVALRAMNLLAAFMLFRSSPSLNDERLAMFLAILDQHGAHIKRNLEFSHVVTSNHYLSDIAGLLWLGLMLPELTSARDWRDWAMAEMLREMDKQILPDGADYEASTGYHRFVLELLLYSLILCQANGIPIDEEHRRKVRAMLGFERAILRPDGLAPLIGDTDGGQVVPIVSHTADDHAYLLALGAVIYKDSQLKLPQLEVPEELLWILGEKGVREYENLLPGKQNISSQSFACSGTYLARNEDLFLLFNASGTGAAGRGSHGHNDALSIEVSACGRAFIVDPGAYVYTADLHERHLFRSTAYHSTVQIDEAEQNSTDERVPFVIGDNARPQVLQWETGSICDCIVAEHSGYERLVQPVKHRRKVTFEKIERWWLVEDEFQGNGEHTIAARFHFDSGLEVGIHGEGMAVASDPVNGARLFVCPIELDQLPQFEPRYSSKNYGLKVPSVSACWEIRTHLPCKLSWAIVPVCPGENELDRLRIIKRLPNA